MSPAFSRILLLVLLPAFGCAASSRSVPPVVAPTPVTMDEPVPATEPRATAHFQIDLPPSPECEERLDLAVYPDRRIEVIAWEPPHDRCHARRIHVRYLTAQLNAAQLLDVLRPHTQHIQQTKPSQP